MQFIIMSDGQVFQGRKRGLSVHRHLRKQMSLNGTKRILHDYSPEIGKQLTIYCYQPAPGFCACVLQTADAGSLS